jgi:hypothetical protein
MLFTVQIIIWRLQQEGHFSEYLARIRVQKLSKETGTRERPRGR